MFSAHRLQNLLQEIDSSIVVLACVSSVDAAVLWFRKHDPPDIIFMDIQLSDGLAFDIFEQVNVKCPIIFTTAYDEYALKAFQVSSIDYILKPFDKEVLQKSLQKYHNFKEQFNVADRISDLENALKSLRKDGSLFKSRFLIKSGQQFITIFTNEIAYFHSDKKVTFLVTRAGKRYSMDESLDEIEGQLNPHDFFRINRQFISYIGSITSVHKYFNLKLKLRITPSTDLEVIVSRDRSVAFKEWLNQ
jgi:DNA-binding LytR/AlgR family response regulator